RAWPPFRPAPWPSTSPSALAASHGVASSRSSVQSRAGRPPSPCTSSARGKTRPALHIIAEAQKAGGLAAFIDAEHALDPTYAQAIGVDLENLYFSQPDNGEQALE